MNTMIRFPSISLLFNGIATTFMRFPFVLLSAIVGTIAAINLVDFTKAPDEFVLQKVLMAAVLGLSLFIALAVFSEKQQLSRGISLTLKLGGVLLLVAYYFSLPDLVNNPEIHLIRFMLLNVGLHFLVASLPFIGGNQICGFWQFNLSLFLRFLIAALYSSVMYIGLMIALASADHLFGFDVKEERYLQLWIIVAGIFNTWIFLAGVPRNLEELNSSDKYPKGLMVFTRYILLPLVALYFIILFSYEMKIIFTWNWPKGWVSQLVLWYSVVGILSLLLLYPLRERVGNLWIKMFSKWFFRALIPLVVMLFLAIIRRISDYGITESRYFVLAMAIGLFVVVIYFIFSKVKDIRIIPLVICVCALLSAYGPWSAFSVSKKSQQERLEDILIENKIVVDGSTHEALSDLPLEDRKEMSSIIKYLTDVHGVESFNKWFSGTDIDSLKPTPDYTIEHQIAGMMGFEYISRFGQSGSKEFFRFNTTGRSAVNIEGYDYLVRFDWVPKHDSIEVIMLGDDSCFMRFYQDQSVFTLSLDNDSTSFENITKLSLNEQFSELLTTTSNENLEQDQLTFKFSGGNIDAVAVIYFISGFKWNDSLEINNMSMQVVLRKQN